MFRTPRPKPLQAELKEKSLHTIAAADNTYQIAKAEKPLHHRIFELKYFHPDPVNSTDPDQTHEQPENTEAHQQLNTLIVTIKDLLSTYANPTTSPLTSAINQATKLKKQLADAQINEKDDIGQLQKNQVVKASLQQRIEDAIAAGNDARQTLMELTTALTSIIASLKETLETALPILKSSLTSPAIQLRDTLEQHLETAQYCLRTPAILEGKRAKLAQPTPPETPGPEEFIPISSPPPEQRKTSRELWQERKETRRAKSTLASPLHEGEQKPPSTRKEKLRATRSFSSGLGSLRE